MSLATITQLINDKLRSDALGDLAPADVVARALGLALVQYGADMPRRTAAAVTVSGDSFSPPMAWLQGRSKLIAVEYPIGRAPMATLDASVAQNLAGQDQILLLVDSLSEDTWVRIHFSSPHAADASTVPAEHENAVACFTAAEICRQAATRYGFDRDATMNAASVNQQSQSGELSRRAKDWSAQYYAQLGLRNPDAPASGGSTGSGAAKPAGTIVQFGSDGHRRGRFSSQGY